MEFERTVPRTELFLRKLVDTASVLDRDPAATYRSDHRGLAADNPPLGVRRSQFLDEPRPGHRITRRRFHRVPPSSLGHPSHQQDPPVTELAGKTAACSRAAARRSRLLAAGPFISRSFTLSSVLSSTFSTFESGR